jgi:hypothetical protein
MYLFFVAIRKSLFIDDLFNSTGIANNLYYLNKNEIKIFILFFMP